MQDISNSNQRWEMAKLASNGLDSYKHAKGGKTRQHVNVWKIDLFNKLEVR